MWAVGEAGEEKTKLFPPHQSAEKKLPFPLMGRVESAVHARKVFGSLAAMLANHCESVVDAMSETEVSGSIRRGGAVGNTTTSERKRWGGERVGGGEVFS